MSETEITEITELHPDRLDAVGSPASGIPFLLLKAAADTEPCPTCKGKKTILAGNRTCPDCKGSGEVAKSDSQEADEQEEELTGEAAKAEWDALDKALSAADRKSMPSSSFAYVDPKGGKHLPIHDEGHVKAALGRFGQQDFSEAKDPAEAKASAASKIKSAAKKHGIELDAKSDVAEAAKSTGVPDESVAEPKITEHLDTGHSGVAGSVVTGQIPVSDDLQGGETTSVIPDEAKVTTAVKSAVVASLAAAIEEIDIQRQAVKDGMSLEATGAAAEDPGSMPWESYDSSTLAQVGTSLAGCCAALDNIQQREAVEAASGNPGDIKNVWDLEEVASALEYALGVTARLSFHEAAEGEATKSAEFVAKVGRKLSGKNMGALAAARDHLNAVIDGAEPKKAGDPGESEEDDIVTTVTKDELAETVAASAVQAVKAILKQEAETEEAAKLAVEKEEAEKNANNGGDISEGDIKPTSSADADDVNAVPDGGKVDPEFVNKSEAEEGTLAKQVADQLENLTKELGSVKETVAKIAKRPRPGGPSLDGQARGLAPAAEGRLSEVAKGVEDGEIESLQKSLDEATDPAKKEQIGLQLTHSRLRRFYETGQR